MGPGRVFRSRADLEPPFAIDMLAGLVFGQSPTFLSVPGPPDFRFAKGLLNPLIEASAAARDGARIRAAALSLYDVLARAMFEPVEA